MHLPLVRRHHLQGLRDLLGARRARGSGSRHGGRVRQLWLSAVLVAILLTPRPAPAQGVELATLEVRRSEGALNLEFVARLNLPTPVEDALQRGVPLYFVAEAQLLRNRWWWRDERLARVSRSWRVAYQPLTGAWRLGLGGLNQTYSTLSEALTTASRSAGWKLVDLTQLDPGSSYYLQFSYRLDTTQLPGPMQFGLSGQDEWAVGVTRTIRVDPSAP